VADASLRLFKPKPGAPSVIAAPVLAIGGIKDDAAARQVR
jgi:hypothetical protein